jgi:hypothetical protein
MQKSKLKSTLIILATLVTLLRPTWATNYLGIANQEAKNKGWDDPIIEYYPVDDQSYWLFNEDAYNYFLLYGLTLKDINPEPKPLLKWYEIMFLSFFAGYITSEIVN